MRQPGWPRSPYLHVAAIAPVLISGFWSILTEHFDPRTAKQAIGRIAAAGTLGGLAGASARRAPSLLGTESARRCRPWRWRRHGAHGASAECLRPRQSARRRGRLPAREVGRRLLVTPYLRNLALLVLGCSVSNTLLDYVFTGPDFRRRASSPRAHAGVLGVLYLGCDPDVRHPGAVVPAGLERAGSAPTIGTLPAAVAVASVTAALIPGPWSVALARGLEDPARVVVPGGLRAALHPGPGREARHQDARGHRLRPDCGDIVGAGITAFVPRCRTVHIQPDASWTLRADRGGSRCGWSRSSSAATSRRSRPGLRVGRWISTGSRSETDHAHDAPAHGCRRRVRDPGPPSGSRRLGCVAPR